MLAKSSSQGSEGRSRKEGRGYHVTEHVNNYYRTARV